MNTPEITLDIDASIATITINRPKQKNAISALMWQAIAESVDAIANNGAVKVVLLRGQPRCFSAGADILEFKKLADSPEALRSYNELIQDAQQKLEELERPTVAVIDGVCMGGGCGLSLCCDFRIASDTSTFAIPPSKLGLIYSKRDTRRLLALVGPSNAKSILYTGRKLHADEAVHMGLVEKLTTPSDLNAEVAELAAMLSDSSQYTIRATKRVISTLEGYNALSDAQIQHLYDDAFNQQDCLEGVAAFKEKRRPHFAWTSNTRIDER